MFEADHVPPEVALLSEVDVPIQRLFVPEIDPGGGFIETT